MLEEFMIDSAQRLRRMRIDEIDILRDQNALVGGSRDAAASKVGTFRYETLFQTSVLDRTCPGARV